MAGALELLEAEHETREAHGHLMRECPWYQHVDKGGRDHPDLHCRPATGEPAGLGEGGALVKFTPRTPEASTVVKPTVPPGGPGLFHMKGHHLPPYIEHLYPHLVARYGKHAAYGVAVGIVKKWAAGVNPGGWDTKSGKGKRTHPDVRAAAARNVAEWEKERAEAHARHGSEHGHSAGEVEGLELARPPVATAPGARPFLLPATPGGRYSQYGLYQNPVQSVSPSPPLPPATALPTAAEVRAVIPLVPDCSDASLSATARKFLEQAAYKLSKDDPLAALAVMRSAQAALYAAHKADQGNMLPSAYTANVFAAIPPAAQSSATTAVLQGRDKVLAWRKAEQALAALTDRIRKRYFHGVFSGPSQLARFTKDDDMTALDRVLALAVTTGRDVSEPTESDTSGAVPLIQPPENLLSVTEPRAAAELAALPAVDKQRFAAYLARARDMLATNPAGAAQSALRACVIAREAGARHLARHVHHHVQALAEMGNMTHQADVAAQMQAGGKSVSPRNSPGPATDNPNGRASLTAVDALLSLATAGSSAGKSAGAAPRKAPVYSGSAHPPAGHPTPESHHLHELHVLHLEHLAHLHALHMEHLEHLASHPAPHSATPGPKSSTAGSPKSGTQVTVKKP
jgi:hypothetical protein